MAERKDWPNHSWSGDRERARGAIDTRESELSWGPGPVPPGKDRARRGEGGMYIGRSPDMTEPPRRTYRTGEPPRGYPGQRVG